jgi:predicted N-acetyltransferase YhbS
MSGSMSGAYAIGRLSETDSLEELLSLVRGVFAALAIDPPSSMTRETIDDMRRRAATHEIFVARADGRLIGSVFCEKQERALYLGRLAVRREWRSRGIGGALLAAAISHARTLGLDAITLRSRTALTANVAFFRRHGFKIVGEKSHPGFDRPTFYEMILELDAAA